jgi:hypothetical protein
MSSVRVDRSMTFLTRQVRSLRLFSLLFFVVACMLGASAQGQTGLISDSGQAIAQISESRLSLANQALRVEWTTNDGKVKFAGFEDLLGLQNLALPNELFVVRLKDGSEIRASEMSVRSQPAIETLAANPSASRASDRVPGKKITVILQASPRLTVTWNGVLRDGSNYLRQEVTLRAVGDDVPISEVRLIAWNLPEVKVVGTVAGSPVVAGGVFAGFENPLSKCTVSGDLATCALARELPLLAGHEVTYSSVIGVTPKGQLRRGFLNYVERERAHPYRTFLHYNTWYDLGYSNQYDQAGVLDRLRAFGTELHQKRGVTLDSFLFDDGWDDPKTLWSFHSGFPDGLTPFAQEAAKYGVAPGIWMSPWGGYGKPHQERIKYGKEQGFETNKEGFELSGPKYYSRFRDVCLNMIRQYGVNQFKFDGTGNVNEVIPGSQFDSDFDAAINLIQDLRATKPDIYINLTTGTHPSPFWLRYADSIWRGGEDHDFAGVGTWRQKWITYRDSDTYEHIVRLGPLYPLNSLMLHGMIYAQHAKNLATDPDNDFTAEVHDYFGTGTQLQEMYITPSLLSRENWDTLAEAARWSRQNADVLRDTHWIGGNPAKLEVYGWASWSPKKAILVLRNPSDRGQEFSLDVGQAFEIPAGAATQFQAKSPWQKDRSTQPIQLTAGAAKRFALAPFEVLTLEAIPVHE